MPSDPDIALELNRWADRCTELAQEVAKGRERLVDAIARAEKAEARVSELELELQRCSRPIMKDFELPLWGSELLLPVNYDALNGRERCQDRLD